MQTTMQNNRVLLWYVITSGIVVGSFVAGVIVGGLLFDSLTVLVVATSSAVTGCFIGMAIISSLAQWAGLLEPYSSVTNNEDCQQ